MAALICPTESICWLISPDLRPHSPPVHLADSQQPEFSNLAMSKTDDIDGKCDTPNPPYNALPEYTVHTVLETMNDDVNGDVLTHSFCRIYYRPVVRSKCAHTSPNQFPMRRTGHECYSSTIAVPYRGPQRTGRRVLLNAVCSSSWGAGPRCRCRIHVHRKAVGNNRAGCGI
jgi:hypothetical protein